MLFSTQKGSCYFNVYAPGNPDAAVHIGSSAGNEFGASPTKAGTYRIQVYQMRAKVEHVLAVIKLKFGFTKVRYRGLDKNAHRLFVTCALTNLFLARRQLSRRVGA